MLLRLLYCFQQTVVRHYKSSRAITLWIFSVQFKFQMVGCVLCLHFILWRSRRMCQKCHRLPSQCFAFFGVPATKCSRGGGRLSWQHELRRLFLHRRTENLFYFQAEMSSTCPHLGGVIERTVVPRNIGHCRPQVEGFSAEFPEEPRRHLNNLIQPRFPVGNYTSPGHTVLTVCMLRRAVL